MRLINETVPYTFPYNYNDPDFGLAKALKYLPLLVLIRCENVLLELQRRRTSYHY